MREKLEVDGHRKEQAEKETAEEKAKSEGKIEGSEGSSPSEGNAGLNEVSEDGMEDRY
jgi:hypothetical protein